MQHIFFFQKITSLSAYLTLLLGLFFTSLLGSFFKLPFNSFDCYCGYHPDENGRLFKSCALVTYH